MMRKNSVMETTTNDTVRIVVSLRRGEDRGRVGHYNSESEKAQAEAQFRDNETAASINAEYIIDQ